MHLTRYQVCLLLALLTGLLGALAWPAAAQGDPLCFATSDDGTTLFSSVDHTALQQAIDAASDGGTVKVAGLCQNSGTGYIADIRKNLTLLGGYPVDANTPNWQATPDPETSPTMFDGNGTGGSLYIADNAMVAIQVVTIRNAAEYGIYLAPGYLTVLDSLIENNAGGIYAYGISTTDMNARNWLRVERSIIRNNTRTGEGSNGYGGGLYLWLTHTTLVDSQILNNYATEQGGGVWAASSLNVINSVIAGNVSDNHGGGFYIDLSSSNGLKLANTTISGNTASYGGGIYNNNDHVLAYNTTITDNHATITGGGYYARYGSIGIYNSIISNNTPVECTKYNLVLLIWSEIIGQNGDIGGCQASQSPVNLIVPDGPTDSFLDPMLQNNGGGTLTHALLANSIAVDVGDNNYVPSESQFDYDANGDGDKNDMMLTDQRGIGFNRIENYRVDIGAYEFDPPIDLVAIYDGAPNDAELAPGGTLEVTIAATGGSGNYTYTIVEQPTQGILSGIGPDYTYTSNNIGPDTFTIEVSDDAGNSSLNSVFMHIRGPYTVPSGDVAMLLETIAKANAGYTEQIYISGRYELETDTDYPTESAWGRYGIVVTDTYTLTGDGPNTVITRSATAPSIGLVRVETGTLTIENLTLTGGRVFAPNYYGGGGAISSRYNLIVDNVIFRENTAASLSSSGGAVSIQDGTVAIHNSRFINNQANVSGYAIYLNTSADGAIIEDNLFLDHNGEALKNDSSADINLSRNVFRNNNGSAFVTESATMTMQDNLFEGNTDAEDGFIRVTGPKMRFHRNSIINNTSPTANAFHVGSVYSHSYIYSGDNCFIGNSNYAAFNAVNRTLNLINNWWGSTDGPSGVAPGGGGAISDYLTYDPFLIDMPAHGCYGLPLTAASQSIFVTSGESIDIALADGVRNGDPIRFYEINNQPQHGVLIRNGNTVTYHSPDGYYGTDSFSYTVTDTNDANVQVVVSITVSSDLRAYPLNFTTSGTKSFELPVTGSDTPFVYDIVALPQHGTLSGIAPNLTYTAEDGFEGSDSFIYRVSDSHQSQEAVVNITVEPLRMDDVRYLVTPGTSKNVLLSPTTGADSITTVDLSTPQHGTLVSESLTSFSYTMDPAFNMLEVITATITDSDGAMIEADIYFWGGERLTVQNRSYFIEHNTPTPISVIPDGGAMPYQYRVMELPTHGSLDIDGNLPDFIYTPNTDFSGSDSFRFEVIDANGFVAQFILSLTVYDPFEGGVVSVETHYQTPALLNPPIRGGRAEYTFNFDPFSGNADIYEQQGDLLYKPNAGFSGTDTITGTATDQFGTTVNFTITIHVRPERPATIFVNSTAEEKPFINNNNCTLREAIKAAETDAPVDGCASGQPGQDVIELPAGIYTLITAESVYYNRTFFYIESTIVLRGAGIGETIIQRTDDSSMAALFRVRQTGNLTVEDMTLRNFRSGSTIDYSGIVQTLDTSEATFNRVYVENLTNELNASTYNGAMFEARDNSRLNVISVQLTDPDPLKQASIISSVNTRLTLLDTVLRFPSGATPYYGIQIYGGGGTAYFNCLPQLRFNTDFGESDLHHNFSSFLDKRVPACDYLNIATPIVVPDGDVDALMGAFQKAVIDRLAIIELAPNGNYNLTQVMQAAQSDDNWPGDYLHQVGLDASLQINGNGATLYTDEPVGSGLFRVDGNSDCLLIMKDLTIRDLVGDEAPLRVGRTCRAEIENVTFQHNTNTQTQHEYGSAIYIQQAHITIHRSRFLNNHAPYGGTVYGNWWGVLIITDSLFYGNTGSPAVYINQEANGSSIHNSCFTENADYAAVAWSDFDITATNNWWGAVDGPGGHGTGSGDEIDEDFKYVPFLTTPPRPDCVYPLETDDAMGTLSDRRASITITPTTRAGARPYRYHVVNQPEFGQATGTDEGVIYDAVAGYVGEVTIVYEVVDALGNTAQGVITIDIQTDPATCFATPDDGLTVYSSFDGEAVQNAINTAITGDTVKIAGTCAGTDNYGGDDTNELAYIDKNITLLGGYDPVTLNWNTAPDSATYPTTLDANQAGRVLYVEEGGHIVTLRHLTLTNGNITDSNSYMNGAGIYSVGNNLTLNHIIVSDNVAEGKGGGIFVDAVYDGNDAIAPSTFTMTNSTVTRNISYIGNGISGRGVDMTIDHSTISENVILQGGSGWGGGIFITNSFAYDSESRMYVLDIPSTLLVRDSIITANASDAGGGIYGNMGQLTLLRTTVSDNIAGEGGGIFVNNDPLLVITPYPHVAQIVDSTFTNNKAGIGGAIHHLITDGLLYITNSTIAYNQAIDLNNNGVEDEAIGGIILKNGVITNSTIAYNTSLTRGTNLIGVGNWSLRNSIVLDGDDTLPNCYLDVDQGFLPPITSGYNVMDDTSCLSDGDLTSIITTDPVLDAAGLQDNGGPTQTIAIFAHSPAVDLVPLAACVWDDDQNDSTPPVPLTTDQRGAMRPYGVACDAGAFETTRNADMNNNGLVEPTDVMMVINRIGTNDDDADLNGDGIVTEVDAQIALDRLGAMQ